MIGIEATPQTAANLNGGTTMTTKDENFDVFLAAWEVERRDRKTKAKEDLYVLLDEHPNITSIDVVFDGCGDSGQVEDIQFFDENSDPLAKNSDLSDAVADYVYSILPGGWEINDGSFGTIHINVRARTAECNFNWRTSEDASFTEE